MGKQQYQIGDEVVVYKKAVVIGVEEGIYGLIYRVKYEAENSLTANGYASVPAEMMEVANVTSH